MGDRFMGKAGPTSAVTARADPAAVDAITAAAAAAAVDDDQAAND